MVGGIVKSPHGCKQDANEVERNDESEKLAVRVEPQNEGQCAGKVGLASWCR